MYENVKPDVEGVKRLKRWTENGESITMTWTNFHKRESETRHQEISKNVFKMSTYTLLASAVPNMKFMGLFHGHIPCICLGDTSNS